MCPGPTGNISGVGGGQIGGNGMPDVEDVSWSDQYNVSEEGREVEIYLTERGYLSWSD